MGAYGSPELTPRPPQQERQTSEYKTMVYKTSWSPSSEEVLHFVLWLVIAVLAAVDVVAVVLGYSYIFAHLYLLNR